MSKNLTKCFVKHHVSAYRGQSEIFRLSTVVKKEQICTLAHEFQWLDHLNLIGAKLFVWLKACGEV